MAPRFFLDMVASGTIYDALERETPGCFHCTCADDTSEHTLSDCTAWDVLRTNLARDLNIDRRQRISLDIIIRKILERKEHWLSFIKFATSLS